MVPKVFARAWLGILLVPLWVSIAHADGTLGLFFDPAGETRCMSSAPFTSVDLYAVSINSPKGLEGFEFSVGLDPRVTVVTETLHPPGLLDFGPDTDQVRNYLVGTGGECLPGPHWVLLVLTVFLSNAVDINDVSFCLGPGIPSSLQPPSPVYLACNQPGQVQRFVGAYEGCAELNDSTPEPECAAVATTAATWGGVKARF